MGVQVRSRVSMLAILSVAAVSMGNQSCEEADKARVLKMEIELTEMRANPVRLPNGETVDFPSAMKSLFYGQVMNSRYFVINSPAPSPQSQDQSQVMNTSSLIPSNDKTSMNTSEVSWRDVQVLERFGFSYSGKTAKETQSFAAQSRPDFVRSGQTLGQNLGQSLESSNGIPGNDVPYDSEPDTPTDLPVCLYNSPQAVLGGEVVSFEATYSGDLRVGYDSDGRQIVPGAGGMVQFEATKLDLRARTDDPLSRQGVALGDGVAHTKKVKFKVDFTAGGAPLGLGFFLKTALADVIKTALDESLEQIVQKYLSMRSDRKDWDDVWESRVIYDPVISDDVTHIAFRGGFRANLKTGDRFHVTNTHYVWEGAECQSRLKYQVPLTTTPGALVEVVSVGDNVAVAKVIEYLAAETILPGAQVTIHSLVDKEKAKKK